MKIYRSLLILALFVSLPFSAVQAADDPAFTERLVGQIGKLEAEKRARTPGQKKMASTLLDAERTLRLGHASDTVETLESPLAPDGTGTALVDLSAEVSPELLAEIARVGGTVLHQHVRQHAIRARLPLSALESLAARRDVRFIHSAALARTNAGPIDSEGDVALQADSARSTFGVDGTGVKVGVLSDSADKLSASQANGELPNVNIIPGKSFIGFGEGEGTAMLEIVHDIAPGAELYFATAFISDTDFADNIRALAAAGCSVIIDDVTYFNESPFQDGVIAQAVNDVSAQGVLYFSAAGNSGSFDQSTAGCWEGDFSDGGAVDPRHPQARFHNFGSSNIVDAVLPGGSDYRVDLFWSDPLGAATDDYDVYVVDKHGNVLRRSTDTQDGTQDPYEQIGALRPGEGLVIVQFQGNDRFLHLETGRGILKIATPGVTRGHNASGAANAFCVAAVDAESRTTPFTSGDQTEFFSSDGPRRIFYHPDGTPITPGNFGAGGGQVLAKPDVTAADGVRTSVRSFGSFFGTSAAAPHAGAIAALLKSFKPTLTPAQIRTAMQSTAIDIGAAGFDRDSGAGILNALAALITVSNVPNQKPVVTTSAGATSYTEAASPVVVDPGIAITDPDSTSFNGGSLTVDISANGDADDVLALRSVGFDTAQVGVAGNIVAYGGTPIGTVSGGANNSALVVNFTSFAVTSDVATAIAENVTFKNTSTNPAAAQRTVRFVANDGSGGTSNPATKLVTVLPVNNAPSFTKGPDQIINNDPSLQLVSNWATNISAGTPDESGQGLTFDVQNDNQALFALQPAVAADGTLSYTAAIGAAGSALVTVTLHDDGGTANGGVDTSAPQTFHIFINAGNIPPSFIAGPDQLVPVNSAAVQVENWAQQITAGPVSENTQQVDFIVMTDNDALFATLPTVSSSGTLVFEPQAKATGIAHVTVRAHDNGGTANGGLDTSAPQTFIIAVSTFAEEVGIYNGLIEPAGGTPREFARYGLAHATVSRTGGLTAKFTLGGQTIGVKGKLDGAGAITFGAQNTPTATIPRPNQTPLTFAVSLDTTFGTDRLTGAFTDGITPFANLLADRAAYSQQHPAPANLVGKYTALFAARDPLQQNLAADQFPQGDGYALVSVGKTGGAKFKGALADGNKVSFGSTLSKNNTLPFHVLTDKKLGSLTTLVTLRDVPNVSDFDGLGAIWFKPANSQAKVYPAGWSAGIAVDLLGSLFAVPHGQAALPNLGATSPAGNALLTLADGGLGSTIFKGVNIATNDRVRVLDHDVDKLAVSLNGHTGAIGGRFIDPADRHTAPFHGVVLRKQKIGSGFFLNESESGAVTLAPPAK